MTNIKIYEVGGTVRDRILGIPNKDFDFAVEAESFEAMRDYILLLGGQIFLETPEHLTIRARVGNTAADYVLCRRDGVYIDGRRPEQVFVGTIFDDLARRDFTMNAIAVDNNGVVIDPYGGRADIMAGLIRCVGNTQERMNEDYLRLLRAIRFAITKNFRIAGEIYELFDDTRVIEQFAASISQDRIRDELTKMFARDTIRTMEFFANHRYFADACFSGGIWLIPTSEKNKTRK